tara:strand:- start:90 stop:314 length:225 start_codon:yes stop_codon:yes gene_type:complete
MKEYYKNIHITQEGLNSIYKPGDLVKINKSKLGIVLFKPNTKQKSLFPYVRVYMLKEQEIYEYGFNSLEIVSKI